MKLSTKAVVTTGMFTAVLSVLSMITIPMPSGVPLTLQTFAMALCGYVLGAKRGIAAVSVYILLGFCGIPVFAGMTGGPALLFGYRGGFIWGFLFLALLCGAANRFRNRLFSLSAGAAGLAVCHLFGVLQFSAVSQNPVSSSFLLVSLPFLLKDAVSVAGAYMVAAPVRKALLAGNILSEKQRA